MRFIHTADIHLGKSFAFLGEKGKQMREAQLGTLQRIADLARHESVDFMVIAGDLFESNEVSNQLVEKSVRILKSIAPVRILILPGTHDLLDEGSVYKRQVFRGENIIIFGIDGHVARINDVAIHGRANTTKQGGVHPLKGIKPDPESKFNVGVAHASIEIEGKASPNDYLISPEEIAESKMDYIALGHWHRMSDFSCAKTHAWYCGSPEATKFDEADKAGNVLLVTIDNEIEVEPRRVGQYEWLERELDIGISTPGDPLSLEIGRLEGKNVLLRLRLKGTLPEGHILDVNSIESEFGEKFFFLSVDDRNVRYSLTEIEQTFAEGTIGSLFVARLEELIGQSKAEEEKALLTEALRLGGNYIARKQEVD